MLKNLSFLTLAGALTLAGSMSGCIVVDTTDVGDEVGDGDGDATTGDGDGDGDGDPTGDGDGEPGDGDGDPTGDGDGEPTGDGDGEPTGDGDGEPAGGCGWNQEAEIPGYYCGFDGEDPAGMIPYDCPADLVAGEACGTVTGAGCCDADGNNWYCAMGAEGDALAMEEC